MQQFTPVNKYRLSIEAAATWLWHLQGQASVKLPNYITAQAGL
jgi:hypothetical protein